MTATATAEVRRHFIPNTGPNFAGYTVYVEHTSDACSYRAKGRPVPSVRRGYMVTTCQECLGGKMVYLSEGRRSAGYVIVMVLGDRIVLDAAIDGVAPRVRRDFATLEEARAEANDLIRQAKAAGLRWEVAR